MEEFLYVNLRTLDTFLASDLPDAVWSRQKEDTQNRAFYRLTPGLLSYMEKAITAALSKTAKARADYEQLRTRVIAAHQALKRGEVQGEIADRKRKALSAAIPELKKKLEEFRKCVRPEDANRKLAPIREWADKHFPPGPHEPTEPPHLDIIPSLDRKAVDRSRETVDDDLHVLLTWFGRAKLPDSPFNLTEFERVTDPPKFYSCLRAEASSNHRRTELKRRLRRLREICEGS